MELGRSVEGSRAHWRVRLAQRLEARFEDLWVCSCLEAYRGRDLIDPQCFLCEIRGSGEDLADAVLDEILGDA